MGVKYKPNNIYNVDSYETKRQFIGFEIDKSYYDIAQDRLNGITQVKRREKEAGIQNIFDLLGE